jgi:hypothetical protein
MGTAGINGGRAEGGGKQDKERRELRSAARGGVWFWA